MTRTLIGALLALALVGAGCGGSDEDPGGGPDAGNAADGAFITDMTAHHEGAIEMARIAQERAEHPEIRRLAEDIIAAQESEIATMEHIGGDMHGEDEHGDAHTGMSAEEMGMDTDPAALEKADPFDKAFIEAMVAHHEGAITMAKDLLERGEHRNLRALAEDIVAAQEREIEQMQEWRERWYG